MGQTLTLLSMSLSDSEFDICFDLLDVLIISSGDTSMTMTMSMCLLYKMPKRLQYVTH